MKKIYTKKEIEEIVDKDNNLIGGDDIKRGGSDMESYAPRSTDYNVKVGHQPFRYDMLGRFGFTMMPFFEGDDEKEVPEMDDELREDLSKLMYEKYIDILKYYYKNPNKLKSDYRKYHNLEYDDQPDDKKEIGNEWAEKIMKTIEPHFLRIMKEEEIIGESKVAEEVIMKEKSETEMSEKAENRDVMEKNVEKIAGLINKLDKKTVNDIITKLETKNE